MPEEYRDVTKWKRNPNWVRRGRQPDWRFQSHAVKAGGFAFQYLHRLRARMEARMADADKLGIKVRIVEGMDKVRAFITFSADLPVIGRMAFNECKIIEGSKGLFVALPSKPKEKDGKTVYYDYYHPTTAEGRAALSEVMLSAYEKELAKT